MPKTAIHADISRAIEDFELPEKLGFGQVFMPFMYRIEYRDGAWGEGRLERYGPIELDPAAKALHFAQAAFEGLKAYRGIHEQPVIFRPYMNAERMNRSAERLSMPGLSEDTFVEGLSVVTAHSAPFIPTNRGASLYLRPLMFGIQADLLLTPSDSCTFLVLASPSEPIISGPFSVLVDRSGTRAAPGGTGHVKASGNYGAALSSSTRANEMGFAQPLWLDAAEHRYVEELSGMNLFAVIDGDLHTPLLSGTILPGVTRDSVIALARDSGRRVNERNIDIDELLADIQSGRCSEVFACGTATIVAPINAIGDRDEVYELQDSEAPLATELRETLLDIQEGRAPDRFDWLYRIPAECFPEEAARRSA